jgi:hypothetical protein
MKSTKATLITTAAAMACGLVHAEEPVTEWRLLGPAFSQHFGTDGAAITRAASKTTECTDQDQPVAHIVSPTPIPGLIGAGRTPDGGYLYWPMTLYIPPKCTDIVVPAERGWHGNNPALGLEFTQLYTDHSDKFFLNAVHDSYGSPSLMLGAGRLWPVLNAFGIQTDAGFVGGIWNRTVLNMAGDGLVRRTVPYVLPSLAITESRTGLGINLGLAPKMSIGGYKAVRTTTLMFQTTWKVRDSKNSWTFFNVGTTGAGELNASAGVNF